MKTRLIFLVLLLLAGSVDAAWTWTTPQAVANYTTQDGASGNASNTIDQNTASFWNELQSANQETTSYEWGLTVDMGQTYNVSQVKVKWQGAGYYTPCRIGVVKVCDDAACSGESDLLASDVSWTYAGGAQSNTASFTTTVGRYVRMEGGIFDASYACVSKDVDANHELRYFAEAEAYVDVNPATIAAGPCRVYCDYEKTLSVPYPVNGNGTTPNAWKITLTDYGTNPEGETELYTNWSNVQLTITNGTQTGTCTGVHKGNITGVRILSTDTPNSLILNYTYGESSATCVSTPPQINICLNGTYLKNKVYTSGANDYSNQSSTYNVGSDFTEYFHYNLTFKNEDTGGWFNNTGYLPMYAYFFCRGDYVGYASGVNLTSGANTTMVQLRTAADVQTQLNTSFSRWYANEAGGVYDIYLRTGNWNVFAFQLNDLTGGQFYGSKMMIKAVVNNTLVVLDVSRFPSENLVYPNLKNNTYYSLIVTNDVSSRNTGNQYLYNPYPYTYEQIVTGADLPLDRTMWEDVNMSITWTYADSTIQCAYQSDTEVYRAWFEVYNYTSAEFTKTYELNSTTPEAVLYYSPVQDRNGTYWTRCSINDSRGVRYISRLINYRNETGVYKGFDLNIPDSILGISRPRLYMFISLGIVLIIAGIFSAASMGVGLIVSVVATMFFAFIGWLDISFWLLFILLFLAIFYKASEGRQAVTS